MFAVCVLFCSVTYPTQQGKRVFIKDIIYYLFPPNEQPAKIAPSLVNKKRGIGTDFVQQDQPSTNDGTAVSSGREKLFPFGTFAEPGNPTVVPMDLLRRFHFAILIRDPHASIPSYYRCTISPLKEMTGFHYFDQLEAGYDELIRFFHFLKATDQIGPHRAELVNGNGNGHAVNGNGRTNGDYDWPEICVIDADDLLDDPETIVKSFCQSVGHEYSPSMLKWDTEEHQTFAKETFAKWRGFHEDAINSQDLRPRQKVEFSSEDHLSCASC